METNRVPDAGDAAAALEQARQSQERVAERVRMPRLFFPSIGAAIAVQILTGAAGGVVRSAVMLGLLVAGVAVFALVAGVQLVLFRRLNGMWVAGLVSKVVLGTATMASLTYAVGLSVALWAGFSGNWWVAPLAAIAGGAGYVASGTRWMRRYRQNPEGNAAAESIWWLVAVGGLAAAGLVLLVAGS